MLLIRTCLGRLPPTFLINRFIQNGRITNGGEAFLNRMRQRILNRKVLESGLQRGEVVRESWTAKSVIGARRQRPVDGQGSLGDAGATQLQHEGRYVFAERRKGLAYSRQGRQRRNEESLP